MMKLLTILLILINLSLILSLEIKVSEYRDPKCAGVPITINSYSKCSPNKYWRILENATKIVSADINSIDECRYSKYSKLKFKEFKNGECKLEENFGYSYKYELNLLEDPKPQEKYCNQLKYYDCNNYNIYSFLNNTCELITSTNFTKQVCVGDKILIYHCLSESCIVDQNESDCKLISSEFSNINKYNYNNENCKVNNPIINNNSDSEDFQFNLQMYQTTNNSIQLSINFILYLFSLSLSSVLLFFI